MFSLFSAHMDATFTTGAQELKSMLYGLVIILFLRFQPRGLVGAWHDHQADVGELAAALLTRNAFNGRRKQ